MRSFSFMTSFLTFYLKGKIEVDQNNAVFRAPNVILKVIPLGCRNYSMPVEQISGVNTSFYLDFKSFIVGLILFFIGLASITNSFLLGFILLLIGGLMTISAFNTILQIEKTSGNTLQFNFLIFDKKIAYEAEAALNNMINSRTNDTNVRVHTTQNTDRIINAINNCHNN